MYSLSTRREMQKRKHAKSLRLPGSRFVWDPAPTRLFLKLWLENIEDLNGSKPNKQIHMEMAEKMCKYGVTLIEVKAKMDNMTKKYRQEMSKYRMTGEPSTWEHFDQIHEILKESKLVNLSLCMNERFDFSPMEDSDSNDSAFSTNNDGDSPAVANPETVPSIESEFIAQIEEPVSKKKTKTVSERILAIEEAKLQVQRKKLKVMKTIADELSSIHREFLKAYRNK